MPSSPPSARLGGRFSLGDIAAGRELRGWGKAKAVFPLGWLVTRQLRSGLRKGMPELEALIAKDPERFKLG